MRTVTRPAVFVLTIGLGSLLASAQTPLFSKKAATQNSQPAPQNNSRSSCPNCGEERWDVKTLSDPAANTVDFTPRPATVKDLYDMQAPTTGSARHSAEKQTYTVHAKLVGYKIEFHPKDTKDPGDHDFHIVIQDLNGTETMVVEIPDPKCGGVCTSIKKDAITQVRSAFLKGVTARPKEEFLALKNPVEVDVTGVLFFDFAHGQTGLAKNCAELHPVLDFEFSSKPSAASDRSNEPQKHPESFYHCLPKTENPQ